MCRVVGIFILIAGISQAERLTGQAVARQGEPEKPKVVDTIFSSPMVLDLPLTDLSTLPLKVPKKYTGIRNNICDDVSFTFLEVLKRSGPHTNGVPATILEVHGALWVRPSYDRDVDLRFELVKDEAVLLREVLAHLDAEEGKVLEFKQKLTLSPTLTSALAEASPPELRITMYVRER
jgi:hypothetical protein